MSKFSKAFNKSRKKSRRVTRKNVKLRNREVREKRKKYSLGNYDRDDVRRRITGPKKGQLVSPKGGFLRTPKRSWAGLSQDQFNKAQQKLIAELYAGGYSRSRMRAELTNQAEGYQRAKILQQALADRKYRDESNGVKVIGKWLDDKILDSNPVGREIERSAKAGWKKDQKTFKQIAKHTPDPVKESLGITKKVVGKDLKWIVDKLARTGYGAAESFYQAALNQGADGKKDMSWLDTFKTVLDAPTEGGAFKKGFLKQGDRPKTFYDVDRLMTPSHSTNESAVWGLGGDLLIDPLNLVGVGIGRGAVRSLIGDGTSKELKGLREAAVADNKRASKYLSYTKIVPAQFKGTTVYKRMRELGLKKHEAISQADWERVLNHPVGRTYRSGAEKSMAAKQEVKFYKDLQKVLSKSSISSAKERQIVDKFISMRAGNYEAKLQPQVEKWIQDNSVHTPETSSGRTFNAVKHVVDEFPGLAETLTRIEVDDTIRSLAHVDRNGTELVLRINPKAIERDFAALTDYINAGGDIKNNPLWGVGHLEAVHEGSIQKFYDAVLTHEFGHVFHHRKIHKETGKPTTSNADVHNDPKARNELPTVSGYAGHDYGMDSIAEKVSEWFSAKVHKVTGISITPSKFDSALDEILVEHLRGNPSETTIRGFRNSLKEDFKKDIRPIERKLKDPTLDDAEKAALKRKHGQILKQYYKDQDALKKLGRRSKDVIDDLKKNIKIDNILEVINKSDDNIRVGITLKVLGKDLITLRGSGKVADSVMGLPMVGKSLDKWRDLFEGFERKSKRLGEPELFKARNKHLTATSRIFQRYADDYHKLFDGVGEAARKAEFSSMSDKLKAGVTLNEREQKIYNLFDDMLPEFKGETKVGDSTLTLGEISNYLPDQFVIKKNTKIDSTADLIKALGSGVETKLDNATRELDELTQAIKDNRNGTLLRKIEDAILEVNRNPSKQAQANLNRLQMLHDTVRNKAELKKRLDTLKAHKKRLNKSHKNRMYDDPLQAVWAARIAVEQAKGWKGLVEDVGATFGIKHKGGKPGTVDADIEKLRKDHGWRTVKDIDGYLFMPDVASKVESLMKLFDRHNISTTMDFFDRATRAWKVSATLYNPGYYTRNMIGEITAGYFGGVNNPKYYTRSGQVLNYIRKSTELDSILRSRTPFSDLLEKGRPKGDKVVAVTKNGDEITESMVVALFHENNLITNFVNTEFHELGSHVGGVSKLGKPFVKGHNALRDLGEVGENFPRMAHFLHALEHAPSNFSVKEAAHWAASEVRKYHFDYSDVTHFERAVMMRLLPFYKWTRKAMPMVVETLLAHPSRIMVYPKAMTGLANYTGNNDQMDGYVPRYTKDTPPFIQTMLAYPVGSDIQGNDTFYNINTTGMDALKAMFDLGAAGQLMLNPAIKTVIEQAWGEKLNEQFDKNGMQGRERISELLGQVPALKYADDLHKNRDGQETEWGNDKDSKLTEPGALMDERTHNFITGLTAIEVKDRKPFDPNRYIEDNLDFGKYIHDTGLSIHAKDKEAGRRSALFMRNNPDKFPQYKDIDKWIDDKGNVDWSLRQYYNKWVNAYGKYTNKDGSIDWNRINRDRAAGTLEQADPEVLKQDKLKKQEEAKKFLDSLKKR